MKQSKGVNDNNRIFGPVVLQSENQNKTKKKAKKYKYFDLARELKVIEHEGNDATKSNWHYWNGHKRLGKGTGEVGNLWTSREHPNNSIVEDSQNTENSPRDQKRLAVTQPPVKDHRLTLV